MSKQALTGSLAALVLVAAGLVYFGLSHARDCEPISIAQTFVVGGCR